MCPFNNKTLADQIRIPYSNEIKGFIKFEKRSTPFIEWALISLAVTVICAWTDYSSLYDIIDEMLNQSDSLSKILTFSIAVAENVMPLLIVYLWVKHKYQPFRYSVFPVIFFTGVLVTVFAVLFYVRWKCAYFTFDMTGIATEDCDLRMEGNQAISLLQGVFPVLSSVINGGIFYISPTPYDLRDKAIRIRIMELHQQLVELDATINILDDREQLHKHMKDMDERGYRASVRANLALLDNMRTYAVLKLAACVGNPDALSWMNMKHGGKEEN